MSIMAAIRMVTHENMQFNSHSSQASYQARRQWVAKQDWSLEHIE